MKSQNGWPVVGSGACDEGPFGGVTFPNGILRGDVATIARWQIARYQATVEPLIKGSCWGWLVKEIKGSDEISNHASATAWDINARKYPLGAEPYDVMSPAKIAACRAIIRAAGGVLRWGGDYTGRKDVMHWEVVGTPAEATAFARKIRNEEALMDNPWDDKVIANPVWRDDHEKNPTVTAGFALANAWDYAHSAAVQGERANQALARISAQLAALVGKDLVDEPAIVAGVLAGLPAAAIAAAIPEGIAIQVADEIGRRMAKPGITTGG